MSDYDIYVLILCLIVFVLLVTLSAISLTAITKMYKRLICCGQEDEKLIKEYNKLNKTTGKAGDIVAYIFNILICVLFVGLLCFSLYINTQEAAVSDTVPTLRVVKSDSMSEKYSGNTYLTENGLDDQFDTFDIILTYKMPDEFELEVYDIVVYEFSDELIIHRIISIEEPNEEHPDSRLFVLRGDANQYSDSYKVEYSQMLGIYRGTRVRYVGSFILFMQSPAGWLCVLLVVAMVFIAPAIESYIGKRKEERLKSIGVIPGGTVTAVYGMPANAYAATAPPSYPAGSSVGSTSAGSAESAGKAPVSSAPAAAKKRKAKTKAVVATAAVGTAGSMAGGTPPASRTVNTGYATPYNAPAGYAAQTQAYVMPPYQGALPPTYAANNVPAGYVPAVPLIPPVPPVAPYVPPVYTAAAPAHSFTQTAKEGTLKDGKSAKGGKRK